MKKAYLLFLISLSLKSTFAIDILFEHPCKKERSIYRNIEVKHSQSVGEISMKVLNESNEDFLGSELGLNSLFKTPIGMDALQIIDRKRMRSYGWCYEVDGEIPEVLTHQYFLNNNHSKLRWYFGVARYDSGEWLSQCEELDSAAHAYICPL